MRTTLPKVIRFEYTLTIDGSIIDRTDPHAPITILTGHARTLPPGLEALLHERQPGQFTAAVPAHAGYGEYDPDQRLRVSRSDLPQPTLKIGTHLGAQDTNGETHEARVVALDGDTVTLELNHPNAGKTLEYTITIHAVRDAATEEIEHGHVHGEGGVVHTHHTTGHHGPTGQQP